MALLGVTGALATVAVVATVLLQVTTGAFSVEEERR